MTQPIKKMSNITTKKNVIQTKNCQIANNQKNWVTNKKNANIQTKKMQRQKSDTDKTLLFPIKKYQT